MRKIIASIIGSLAVIFIFWWLINFLTTGKIYLTTDNPQSTIVLSKVGDPKFSKQASKLLVLKAKTGQYIATVKGSSKAVTQVIDLKAHKTIKYAINPVNPTGVEPVINAQAQSINVDTSQLLYVDVSNGYLFKLDAENNSQGLFTDHLFHSVKWADSSYGIAQDSKGHLFIIDNNNITPLNTPFSYSNSDRVDYAVAASRQIYLSFGSDVYSGHAGGQFKKIYTSDISSPTLIASASQVTILSNPDSGDKSKGPSIVDISETGKIIKKNIGSFVGAWSPSGKYLVVSSKSGGEILDSSLKHLATMPLNDFNNPYWLDDSTLIYSKADQLWKYNLLSKRSDLIANMPLGGPITELTISKDKSYIYVAVSQNRGGVELKRVGLKNQEVPEFLYQLQSILPLDKGQYALSLVNFTKPTVLVKTQSDSPSMRYQQDARAELQKRGFDLSRIDLRFTR